MKVSVEINHNITSNTRASENNIDDVSRLILRYEPEYVFIH